MGTVERRSCSAISPNPGMAMLFGSVGALADDDAGFLECAATNKLERQRFANGFGAQLPVNVFEPGNRLTSESHKNVADNDASLVRRTFGLNFKDDGRGLVVALQCFSQRIRQTDGLQT